MSLRSNLQAMCESLPDGASITLPVQWLRAQLDVEPEDTGVMGDLRLEDVADSFDRSVSTVRTWCNSGRIVGAYKLGREWRIPRSALQSLRDGRPGTYSRSRPVDLAAWRKVRHA